MSLRAPSSGDSGDSAPSELVTGGDALSTSKIKSTHPLHRPRLLSVLERERYRDMAARSRAQASLAAEGRLEVVHAPNTPVFRPEDLMPQQDPCGLRALSLYSGGEAWKRIATLHGSVRAEQWVAALEAGTVGLEMPKWPDLVVGGDRVRVNLGQ